jgi:hypothetical protein
MGRMIRLVPNKMIRLGGKLYDIRYQEEDIKRRKAFFETGKGALSADEDRLLKEIGLTDLDKQLSQNDKNRLPAFFEALPECQTTAAISLSAKCYEPQFIITEILRHAALEEQEEHEEMVKKGLPSLDLLARGTSAIHGLLSRLSAPAPSAALMKLAEPIGTMEQDIYDFFELRI